MRSMRRSSPLLVTALVMLAALAPARAETVEEVYRYRIRSSPEHVRRLFLVYLDRINELAGRPEFYHLRWNFVKGWTQTSNLWSTNVRMDTVWLDLPELPHAR